MLVLNRLWQAVNICTARRAFSLVYAGHAHVVSSDAENNFLTHDFDSWRDFSATAPDHELVTTISWKIRVPRVIVLLFFDRLPKKEVKFTRHNVFERDKNTCQYCGHIFDRNDLNLDHVVPRDRGRNDDVGKRGLLVYPVQHAEGQSTPAGGAHDVNSKTEAAEMAPVPACHVFVAAARELAAFCRSRLLERGVERLRSGSSKFQAPTSKEAPSFKFQSRNTLVAFLCLVIGASLELGW